MNLKKNLSALLAGCMLAGMLPAAGAAASPVVEYETSGQYAELMLIGLPANERIHSAQLELTMDGLHDVTLSQDGGSGDNSTDRRVTIERVSRDDENMRTTVTVYVDAIVSLVEDGTLPLGTLAFANTEKSHSFGSTGTLTLLDERQNPITSGTVTVRRQGTGGNSGSDTDDTGSTSGGGDISTDRNPRPNNGNQADDAASTPPVEETPAPVQRASFSDVPQTEWYAGAVDYVYRYGMMAGTSATTFSPNVATNRAMIVSILYRLEGSPAASGGTFPDIAAGQYYTSAVAWAAENGIVSGGTDGLFHPDDVITREQLAAILYRYAHYKGYNILSPAALDAFSDADTVSRYAVDAMGWAVAQGLISGTNRGALDPTGGATRAQAASILMRFCQGLANMP